MTTWDYNDFPHKQWKNAEVFINGQKRPVEKVEYGTASTGQEMVSITFPDKTRLNIWRNPDYAVWNLNGNTISGCPIWQKKQKKKSCEQCYFLVTLWKPNDEVHVITAFCQGDNHKKLEQPVHLRLHIRNEGYIQTRFD